jgi:ankyrin repeat protein
MKRKSNSGWSALTTAARHGSLRCFNLLVEEGLNYNEKVLLQWTPLHFSVTQKHAAIVKRLIEMECDVNATDEFGMTALHYACRAGHIEIVKLLLAHRLIDLHVRNLNGV